MTRPDTINNTRILLMCSDAELAARRCAELALAGWQVIQAADEVEALSAVRSRRVDLALLALPIQETIGMDLPGVLRKVALAERLPVIILTGSSQQKCRCEYLDSGADDIVSEQISGRELSARIRAQLRLKELNENLAASRAALQQSLRRERELLAKLRRDNAHLRVLATTDPLTHAQNVRAFQDILVHSFRVAKRYGQTLSLLMMDADHFKLINDSFGHPSGDYVLKELAVIFTQSVRESDVVARIGGEEFAVILPDADNEQAAAFAERIRAEVYARKFIVFKKHIHVTISIGSATYPSDAEITDPEMLMYFADQALLYAKEAGRDRVVRVCDLDMSVRRRMRHQYLQPPWTGQDVPELQPAME